ncbi:MAG: substrate-binding domain-containing protein [Bacillota bacterium]
MPTLSQEVSFLSKDAFLRNGAFLENVPKPSRQYKIANISRTLLNEHWVMNKEGFMAALKHYGFEGQVFAVQSEQDVIEQANILDTVVRKGYDAVVVSPISEKNLLPGLAEATKKGIVIINVDTAAILEEDAKAKGIKIATFIGSDNYEAGVDAANFIADCLNGKQGKVAVVRGRPGDTCAIDRSSGFIDTVHKYSNLKLVGDQSGMWDRMKALDVTTNMLRANPDIVGIYYNNDTMVLGGIQAAKNLGYKVLTGADARKHAGEPKTLIIIGNDGIPEALQKVKDGELTGTIAQKPYLMGYAAVEAAIIALEGGSLPKVTHTPIKLITQSDL